MSMLLEVPTFSVFYFGDKVYFWKHESYFCTGKLALLKFSNWYFFNFNDGYKLLNSEVHKTPNQSILKKLCCFIKNTLLMNEEAVI